MFGRRILVLVLVLMGLTALAASLTPPPQTLPRGAPATSPSPTPEATGAPFAASPRSIDARVSADGPPRVVSARTGDTITIDVTGDVIDTVVNDDLAISEPIAPDSPAQMELFAVDPGRFPLVLLDSGRRIGTLRITRSS
jgi:endonuclease YncB( thermonuclease family)